MLALVNQSRIARKSYKESLGTLSGSFALRLPLRGNPQNGFFIPRNCVIIAHQ
jgi:hypothetical protein